MLLNHKRKRFLSYFSCFASAILFLSFFLLLGLVLNVNTIDARVFYENESYYVEQKLGEQWNLIAGISFNDIHKSSYLTKEAIFKSYYYDAKTGKDIEIRPDYKAGNVDSLILYSNAFWVFSAKPGKIVYKASPSFVNKSRVGGYYKFYRGNNLIAINEEMYGKSLDEIKGNCSILEASYWDAGKQNWTILNVNAKLNFKSKDELTGMGIRIKVAGDCEFFGGSGGFVEICRESDNGKNYYVFGNITKGNISQMDFCTENILTEFYCNNQSNISYENYTCENGCLSGKCELFTSTNNTKLMSRYSSKEVFLVSDNNWKDVLQLVPLTTWTGNEQCQKGYGTPEKVCLYPTLIWHKDYFNYTQKYEKIQGLGEIQNGYYYDFYDNTMGYITREGIYTYNVLTKQKELIDNNPAVETLAMSKNHILFSYGDWRLNRRFLVLYNRSAKTKEIIHNFSTSIWIEPSISEKYVFLEDLAGYSGNRNIYDIYYYDLSSKTKKKIAENVTSAEDGIVSDNYVIWREFLNSDWYLNIYNINLNKTEKISLLDYIYELNIRDNKIFFLRNGDIWYVDLSEKQERKLNTNKNKIWSFDIFQDRLVYEFYDGSTQVMTKNLNSNEEEQITADLNGNHNKPKISYDNIVFYQEGFVNDDYNVDFFIYNPRVNETFHEFSSFDADSIIYFMQQYNPEKVTIVENTPQELNNLLVAQAPFGAGLSYNKIQKINISDFFGYWQNYSEVVYVEDNYELALMASSYASLINAPLIIQGTILDNAGAFVGKKIICVGGPNRNCDEEYTLEKLQNKYNLMTQTDKFIIASSEDLFSRRMESMQPEKSANQLFNLYYKDSLLSPILAGSKHQLIIFANGSDYIGINGKLKQNLLDKIDHLEYSCIAGDACSENFLRENFLLSGKERNISFNLNLPLRESNKRYTLIITGFLLDCGGENDIEVYINNQNIDVYKYTNCFDSNNFPKEHYGNVYLDDIDSNIFTSGNVNITLKYNGSFVTEESNNLVSLYSYNESSWDLVASCRDIQDCEARDINTYNLSAVYSESDTYFNLNNIDLTGKYILTLSANQEYWGKKFKVYLNDDYFEDIEFSGEFKKNLEIPKNLIKESIRIKVEPVFSDWWYFNYRFDVYLKTNLLEKSLTILGSPYFIPIKQYMYTSGWYEIDRTLDTDYADIDRDKLPDMAVGRIMGITPSDTSSYVARSLFYDSLGKSNKATFMASSFEYMLELANNWSSIFRSSGYNVINESRVEECGFDPNLWKNNDLISYDDHGSNNWAGIISREMPLLSNSFVSNDACSTCSYSNSDQFCTTAIRKGALGHAGAVSVAWTGNNIYMNILNGIYYENKTLGQAFSKGFVYNDYKYQTTLIGDPTLHLNPNHLLNNKLKYSW